MADYLSEIVAKSMGTAEVIRPRRTARFEPVQTKNEFVQQNEFQHMESSEESLKTDHVNSVDAFRKPVLSKNEPDRKFAAFEKADQRISNVKVIDSEADGSSEQVDFSEVSKEKKSREPELESPDFGPQIQTKPIDPEHAKEKPHKIREDAKDIIESQPVDLVRTVLVKRVDSREAKTNNNHITRVSPESRLDAEIPVQNIENRSEVVVRPQIESRKKPVKEDSFTKKPVQFPRERFHLPDNEPVEKPTINVSIGRVEIRAVSSPAVEKRPAQKPQTVSLDEYLKKRRSGGER